MRNILEAWIFVRYLELSAFRARSHSFSAALFLPRSLASSSCPRKTCSDRRRLLEWWLYCAQSSTLKKHSFSSGSHVMERLYQSGTPSFMCRSPLHRARSLLLRTCLSTLPLPPPLVPNLLHTENQPLSSSPHRYRRHRDLGQVQEKQKRRSEMVDKRMSTISTDRKSMSTASAQAATRLSAPAILFFSFSAICPPSMVPDPTLPPPDMAQIRRPCRSYCFR